nr:response regulator [Pseudomonas insulae]
MIVEDEKILAQNLRLYLEQQWFVVQTVADGASALELAPQFQPEVIVLDYRLPDMEGFEVIDALGRDWRYRCLLITGHPTCAVCEAAAQRDIDHILFKPFPLQEMGRVVTRLLANLDADLGEDFPLHLYDGSWRLVERHELPGVLPAGAEKGKATPRNESR